MSKGWHNEILADLRESGEISLIAEEANVKGTTRRDTCRFARMGRYR